MPSRLLTRCATAAGICLITFIAAACSSAGPQPSGSPTPSQTSASASPTGPIVWPAPANPEQYIRQAGLVSDSMEHFALHVHDHLDILVNGQRVHVPANLGIDEKTGLVSELHTHDESGIVHVEAADKNTQFRLGQLFTEWNVPLSETQINGYQTSDSNALRAYVNGVEWTGNPADIPIKGGQEIVLVYGPASTTYDVPSTYTFPKGY